MVTLALGIVCKNEPPRYAAVSGGADTVAIRYIVRRLNHSTEERGSTLFVASSRSYMRTTGPLFSTWAWFEWALSRWRNAIFIGHAEDDASIHHPTLRSVVHAVSMLSRTHPRVVFGDPELFHWTTESHRSHFFWSYHRSHQKCEVRNVSGSYAGGHRWHANGRPGSIYGPFAFMTGPLFFMDRVSLGGLLQNPLVLAERDAALRRTGGDPWDDVFWGFALSVSTPGTLTIAHAPGLYDKNRGSTRGSCTSNILRMVHHKMCNATTRTQITELEPRPFSCTPGGRTCNGHSVLECRRRVMFRVHS